MGVVHKVLKWCVIHYNRQPRELTEVMTMELRLEGVHELARRGENVPREARELILEDLGEILLVRFREKIWGLGGLGRER